MHIESAVKVKMTARVQFAPNYWAIFRIPQHGIGDRRILRYNTRSMHAPLQSTTAVRNRPRGPFRAVADFFNSIRLGIFLIAAILLYGTLGSAIPGFRHRFELTEFQYFNHRIFFILIVLFCINLTVATLRRIKFNRINAGVLTVHTGLLLLCYGSVVYFGNKIEGDIWLGTPNIRVLSRERLQANRDQALLANFPAIIGEVWEQNAPMLGGLQRIEVTDVQHEGMTTAARVTLKAKSGAAPEETITLTLEDAAEGGGRIASFGDRFVLMLSGSDEASYFYDDTTPALIIPFGNDRAKWAHFELPALPYYNERFVQYADEDPRGRDLTPIRDTEGNEVKSRPLSAIPLIERWRMPFDVIDPASTQANDWPFTIQVDGFLPYTEIQPTALPGGDKLFPLALIDYVHGGDRHSEWLISEAPEHAMVEFHDGLRAELKWVGGATAVDPVFTQPINGRHVLSVFVKDKNIRRTFDVEAGQVIQFEGTDYTLTIDELRPSWPLMTPGFQNAKTPIALVVVKSPTMEFQRSVMQRFPQLNQDRYPQSNPDPEKRGKKVDPARDLVDDNIELSYVDASTDHLLIVTGENLAPTLVHTAIGGARSVHVLKQNEPFKMAGGELTLREFHKMPRFETVPVVIPEKNRRSLMDVKRSRSAVRLLLKAKEGDWMKHVWVPFSQYNTDNFLDQVASTTVNGVPRIEQISFIYGRTIRPLPTSLTLGDFRPTSIRRNAGPRMDQPFPISRPRNGSDQTWKSVLK
ncbi:MAG: hypothetical protein IPK83_04350 [Planctomycetes bacterium]|nr:hypothetical protein [Planctomycetota bacterium]